MYSSFNTGITNNNGVATLNYNCQSNKTLTATYSNASASCSVVSNYVPPTIGWNMPLSSYILTDQNNIILDEYEEYGISVNYFDSYIDNYEDLINYDYSDSFSGLTDFTVDDFPIDLTDYENINSGDWVNPITIYIFNAGVYLLCSYELVDEDTLVATVTNTIFGE